MVKNLGTLTEPGTTDPILVNNYRFGKISFILSNINTSVTIRLERSDDRQNWISLSVDDKVLTKNENYELVVFQEIPIDYLRLNFVSEEGGTDAVLTNIKFKGGDT